MPTLNPVIMAVPAACSGLTRPERQHELSRLARKSLVVSAQKTGRPLPAGLEKNQRGAPLPVDGLWWSVTHKPEFVGGIVSLQKTGIDIEKIVPTSPALLKKIVCPDEQRHFTGDTRTMFFRCWTAKEAVLKAEGRGLGGLARCRIDQALSDTQLMVVFDERCWIVEHWFFNGHLAAVVKDKTDHVQWTLLDECGEETSISRTPRTNGRI